MSSLFRDLTEVATAAKLNKNELLIFTTLLNKTLGYGKAHDNLTDKHLARLTGIRLDHFRPALKSFLERDIFTRIEHPQYDYRYSISERFLAEYDAPFYTPALPKTGETAQKTPPVTGNGAEKTRNRAHTTTHPDIKKPPQTTPNNTTNLKPQQPPKKNETPFQPPETVTQQVSVKIVIPKVDDTQPSFFVQTSGQTLIEISQYAPDTIASTPTITSANNHTEATEQRQTVIPATAETETETIIEPATAQTTHHDESHHRTDIATTAHSVEPSAIANPTIDAPTTDDTADTQSLELLKAVGKDDYNACHHHLQTLTSKQQEKVLLVFFCMLKTGTIRSKTNYFIGLTRSAKEGRLTIPRKTKEYTPEQIAIDKEADKEREERNRHWSDYRWVQQQAIAQNKSEEEIANTMGMEMAYALFGQSQAHEANH